MESPPRLRKSWRRMNQDKLVKKVIWPAIQGQTCPICFISLEEHYRAAAILEVCLHAYCIECIRKWSNLKRKCPLCNAGFDSWFCNLSISSLSFRKQRLPSLDQAGIASFEGGSDQGDARRVVQRTRIALNNSRTRPLPWRRSFGLVTPDVMAQRKLEWRSSIYNQRLQAIPSSSRSLLEQNTSRNNGIKEKIQQRIEPWIRRELQAVLGDPDPTIIVHVATSQFIASVEEKANTPPGQLDVEDRFIAPMRPFLHDKSNMFWHELRCFAESSYNMETYDAVVDYECLV